MIPFLFYSASAIAIITTLLVLLSRSPVYAVLYLILSLFAVSVIFYTLGAPFIAVLEVIVYAGAIMVLFLFVVMMLDLGKRDLSPDLRRPSRKQLTLPVIIALIMAVEVILCIAHQVRGSGQVTHLTPAAIGMALYNQHYFGVELASLILLIGIVGGMHLGRAASEEPPPEVDSHVPR